MRRLQEIEVELGPILHHREAGGRVLPEILHIDHQDHVGAQRLAHRGDHLGMAVVALLHAAMGIGPVHGDLGLHRLEAQGLGLKGRFHQGVAIFLEAMARRLQRGIGRHEIPRLVAQQRMDRLAQRLAAEIPERHFDGAHGMDHHAAPPVHGGAEIELLPQRPDLEGIGAHQHFADGEPHGVGAGRLDAGLGHPGIGVAFADPGDALIRMDGDDQAVLGGRGEARVVVGGQQDVAIDAGDLQTRRWAVETRRDGMHEFSRLEGCAGRQRLPSGRIRAVSGDQIKGPP